MNVKTKQKLIDIAVFFTIGVSMTLATEITITNWPLYLIAAALAGAMYAEFESRGYKKAISEVKEFQDEHTSMMREALEKANAMRDEARATLEATRKIAGEGIGGA